MIVGPGPPQLCPPLWRRPRAAAKVHLVPHDSELARVSRTQCGLFTLDQAVAAGFDADTIHRRVKAETLVERQPNVFQATTGVYDAAARAQAALLAGGPVAMLSHTSAAFAWGLVAVRPERPWITLPFTHRLPALEDVEVFRSRHTRGIRRSRNGQPVTAVPRTWVDLGAVLEREAMEAALATALHSRRATTEQIEEVLAVAHHRAGTQLARSVLSHFVPEWESVLSARLGRLMAAAGLTLEPGIELSDDGGVRLAVLDFGDRALRVAVEADGWAFHGSKVQQQADRARDRLLLRRGWVTLRFTTDDIVLRPEQVIAEIRAVLSSRLAAGQGHRVPRPAA